MLAKFYYHLFPIKIILAINLLDNLNSQLPELTDPTLAPLYKQEAKSCKFLKNYYFSLFFSDTLECNNTEF